MVILLFIFFFIYYYIFINKKIINIYIITLFYICIAFYAGIWTFDTAKHLVNPFDEFFLEKTILLFKISYFYLILGLVVFLLIIKVSANKQKVGINNFGKNLLSYVFQDVPLLLILITSIPLLVVFFNIYIPIFQDNLSVSKYFQDRITEFTKYRPFYTLSINMLSVFLFIQISFFIKESNKKKFFQLFKIVLLILLLIATGKRGQVFFPLFITGLSFLLYKKKYISLLFLIIFTMILGSLLRIGFNNISLFSLKELYQSFSSSFFVSIRELTRLLSFFNDSYLYGLTYIADFTSFIPTSIYSFKDKYNFMRYITYLSGEDPNLFGGMRATYIGEAYINFGIIGITLISIIFSLVLIVLQKILSKNSIYQSFEYYLLLFWSVKMVVLPFFENGSAMFLFFLITLFAFVTVTLFNKTIKVFK